jgi:hypothetical protein
MSQSNPIQLTINSLFNLAYPESYKLPSEVQLYLFYPKTFESEGLLSVHDQVSNISSILAYWTGLFAAYLPLENSNPSSGLSNTLKVKRMKDLRPEYFESVLEAFEPALMKYVTNAEERLLYEWAEVLKDLIGYPCLKHVFSWLNLRLKENLFIKISDFLKNRTIEKVSEFLEEFQRAYSVFNDMIQVFTAASLYILDIVLDVLNSSDDHRSSLQVMQRISQFKYKLGRKHLKLFKKIQSILGKFDDEKMINLQVDLEPLCPEVTIDKIVLDRCPIYSRCVGQKYFIRVFRGTASDNIPVVAKEYFGFEENNDFSSINEEIRVLTCLNQFSKMYKIFLKLFFVYRHPSQVVFYMEDGGQNLMDLLTTHRASKTSLDTRLIESWIHDLIDGFTWLETCKMFHRNIKPHNMLINSENCIKVIDFSTFHLNEHHESSFLPTQINPIQGTEGYMAPELREPQLKGQKNTFFRFGKADVFSLGLTILQIITLEKLDGYNLRDNNSKLMNIVHNCHADLWIKEMLKAMLHPDRKKRASFKQCMEKLPGRSLTILN